MEEPKAALAISEVTAETTLLISGPPMSGKYELMLRLLADTCDRVVLVTTKNRCSRIVNDYRAVAGEIPADHLGVIDCVSHDDGDGTDSIDAIVKHVKSPGNLTRIGVSFTELLDRFDGAGEGSHGGVGIHSLSQVIMHTDAKQLYRFLHVLTGQIRNAGWMGIAVIDDSVAAPEDLSLLQHHFDGVLQTREALPTSWPRSAAAWRQYSSALAW